MSSAGAKAQPKRTRRTTEEVVDRLMEAAVAEFEDKGFVGATTAAIARRAGVAEALLFNHFGSKAQLFQDTIFKPLGRHFDDFVQANPFDEDDDEIRLKMGKEYIQALLKFVHEHAGMFMSLAFAQSYKPAGVEGLASVKGLHDYFDRMTELATNTLKEKPRVDPKWMSRISFATILSCVLFRDWLFPDSAGHEDEIRNAINEFVMDGINANNAFPRVDK